MFAGAYALYCGLVLLVAVGILFAPMLHPALKHAAPVRSELKIRTVLNLMGPLCNPAGSDANQLCRHNSVSSPDDNVGFLDGGVAVFGGSLRCDGTCGWW